MFSFEVINHKLSPQIKLLLSEWCPGGRIIGQEYCASTIAGGKGDSFKFNLVSFLWSDFATGQSGGDIVSLYAEINGLSQKESALKLISLYNIEDHVPTTSAPIKQTHVDKFEPVTHEVSFPENSTVYEYKLQDGGTAFYITRTDLPDGKKTFFPTSQVNGSISRKAWPKNRPLYKLPELTSDHVLVVEGEKCADELSKVTKKFSVTTWSGGANAWDRTDLTPLHDKHVLLWPDADEPGVRAMELISKEILPFVKSLRVISTHDLPKGFDAADAIAEGWSPNKIGGFITERARTLDYAEPEPENEDDPGVTQTSLLTEDFKAFLDRLPVTRNDKKQVILNESNILIILQNLPEAQAMLWFDEFHNKVFTKDPRQGIREWTSEDTLKLMIIFQNDLGLSGVKLQQFERAVTAFVHLRSYKNEPREWLESLTWDKQPRVEEFLKTHVNVVDYPSVYTRSVSKNFWVSIVARIMDPGCQVDNMVIFEGPQGGHKSTMLRIIGHKYYAEVTEDPSSKDFYMAIQGKFLIEMGELASLSKGDANTLKKVITTRYDRFRPPYGREPRDFPRRCIFAGTTNETDYLRDTTGNRRFWPVRCGFINKELIKQDRDQLFAEALFMYKSGETWWEVPDVIAEELQNKRLQEVYDDRLEIIEDWLVGRDRVTTYEIYTQLFDGAKDRFTRREANDFGRLLRKLGWASVPVRESGRVVRRWIKQPEPGLAQ